MEHLAAFGISGLLFSIAYPTRRALIALAGIGFTAVLEGLQIWAPGRHARVLDLTMDASGFCIGVALGLVVYRFLSR